MVVPATAAFALTDLKNKLSYIACLDDVVRGESCSEAYNVRYLIPTSDGFGGDEFRGFGIG